MATLTRHLIDDYESYLQYFATTSFYFKGRNYRNHNKLLGNVEGIDCCKTGFTNASGWNLVASAKRGDKRVIGVILGGHTPGYRDAQMTKLINATFKKLNLSFNEQSHLYEEDEVGALVDEITKSLVKINKKPTATKCAKPIKKKRV
jgi:D-alanyl-D-alanine carboxypeptidase